MANKTKRNDNRPRLGTRLLLRMALVLFVIFCAVSIVTVQNSIVERKRELAALETKIETLTAQNEELQDLIKADDIGRYMEKLAVENNGYAYPDERRYYDTSRD